MTWLNPTTMAGLVSTLLALVFIHQFCKRQEHLTLTTAALFNSFWLFSISSLSPQIFLTVYFPLFLEAIHYCIWILALSRIEQFNSARSSAVFVLAFWSSWFISAALFLTELIQLSIPKYIGSVSMLALSFLSLFLIERLFKYSKMDKMLTGLCLGIALLLLYDILHHSISMTELQSAELVGQFRPFIYLIGSILMCFYVLISPGSEQNKRFRISHSMAFYGSTLVSTALFISLITFLASLIKDQNDIWTNAVLMLMMFAITFSVIASLLSANFRNTIRVQLNKHFFSHKYDYRTEWLKVNNTLSNKLGSVSPERIAVKAIAKPFDARAGALWMLDGDEYRLTFSNIPNCEIGSYRICKDHTMCQRMISDAWIFNLHAPDNSHLATFNDELPTFLFGPGKLWLMIPLMVGNELDGFIGLTTEKDKRDTNWEDLDIIRTISGQIASYLRLHQYEKQLEEEHRLSLYNQLSSFIMHDLNNLIAQQSLVVKNAEKHIDNPAFVADTIYTISNSVNRMKELLFKLRNNQPERNQRLNLDSVIKSALQHSADLKPVPDYSSPETALWIEADADKLMMSISHLLKNAQEATPDAGTINLEVNQKDTIAEIVITDNGKGMEQKFIDEKLFKPFESTKSNRGMGIGVYLTKEYINQLDGSLHVTSEISQGTTFKIQLPLAIS